MPEYTMAPPILFQQHSSRNILRFLPAPSTFLMLLFPIPASDCPSSYPPPLPPDPNHPPPPFNPPSPPLPESVNLGPSLQRMPPILPFAPPAASSITFQVSYPPPPVLPGLRVCPLSSIYCLVN